VLTSIRYPLLACAAAAGVALAGAHQLVRPHATWRGAASATPQDEFIDLGRYKLHTVLAGRGKPVVVFESGMGDDASSWEKVQPEIARSTRTVAYDRPGLGKSDPAPEPHDLRQSAVELHTLLQKSGAPPPYILVGHSMGAFIVRLFAFTYPRETAGLVLVDPSDERFDEQLHTTLTKEQWGEYQDFMKKHLADPMMRAEMQGMATQSEAAGAVPLPNVPKILLSASDVAGAPAANLPYLKASMALHHAWVERTPGAELVMVPTADHYIQTVAPDAVIAAIRKVMKGAVVPGASDAK
jgi:pimeloyl-ACP methyl ester carboxylesterase